VIRTAMCLLALAAIGAVLTSTAVDEHPAPPVSRLRPPVTSATPQAPALPRIAIDRQDRTSSAHRRREAEAFDARPLLSALPLERACVRIDIAGLAREGRTTVLSIAPGVHGRAFARAVYKRALALLDDPGTTYRLRWQR
jgi:hypothetical protein